MKYDQHLLESAYKKIYVREDSSFFNNDYDPLPNAAKKSEAEENREIEQENDREESNDSMQEIINELGNRIASPNLLKNLNMLDSNGIEDLISTLNEEQEWTLKDNLIRFLFVLKGYQF
jgi:restriction endonuclease Mrr